MTIKSNNNIDYEKEVRKVYPNKTTISCSFFYCRTAKEKLWHVEFIDLDNNKVICLGKGIFKQAAWQSAYNKLKREGKIL